MELFRANNRRRLCISSKVKFTIHSVLLGSCQEYFDAVWRWIQGIATTDDMAFLRHVEKYPAACDPLTHISRVRVYGWYIAAPYLVNTHGRRRIEAQTMSLSNAAFIIRRCQQQWRARRLLALAAEWLSRPESEYQQLVNCGAPARNGWYGIRVVIQIPDEQVKHEWKQLDSLLDSGYSLAQTFGVRPTLDAAAGSTAEGAKRKRTRKQTRPRRLPPTANVRTGR